MDNLTHSFVGALIGQAGLKRKTGLAMPALIIGANLPDVDAACFFWLDGVEHLGFRRGITHGPIAWVLLPLALAAILYGWDRWQTKRGKRPEKRLPVSFKWLFLLAFIGCLTHPALDWLNSYGIRLLEPFSHQWFYGDTLFIIDIWLWLLMGFATWFSLRREKRGGEWRKPARIAIALVVGYVGANSAVSAAASRAFEINNVSAKQISVDTVIASPVPIVPWRRELIVGRKNEWYSGGSNFWFIGSSDPFGGDQSPHLIAPVICVWPDTDELVKTRPDLKAFLFWSRAPFVTPLENGKGIQFNDARFYNPLTQGRFSVEVPGVECEELPVANEGP